MSQTDFIFVVNPSSRGGKALNNWKNIETKIKNRFKTYRCLYTRYPKHATQITKDLLKEQKPTTIIAVGGDGTVNEVVNGCFDKKSLINPRASLAVLSNGTGQDFVKNLSYPKDIDEVLDLIQKQKCLLSDIACVEFYDANGQKQDKFFINELSIGIGADAAYEVNQNKYFWSAKFTYLKGIIKTIFNHKPYSLNIKINNSKSIIKTNVNNITLANGKFCGGGLFISPKSQIDSGYLNIICFENFTKSSLCLNLPKAYWGKHLQIKGVTQDTFDTITITSFKNQRVFFETDGEHIACLPIKVQNLNKKIRIISNL